MAIDKYAGEAAFAFCAGVSDSQPWTEKRTAVQPSNLLC